MSLYYKDNIVAIATAPENGAIGIVRLSGPDVLQILGRVFQRDRADRTDKTYKARYMYLGAIVANNGEEIDQAMAVYMPGPNSFTGEDVVELHCHGNLILLKQIVAEILELSNSFNIRGAEPGEFTKRAYLNGKMDLTQAEAIHDMITAGSEAAIQSSLKNLDGRLSNNITSIKQELKVSLALVEASFEFPEEDIQTYDHDQVVLLIQKTKKELEELDSSYATSKLYDHGISVAIVGAPNVGKSSLLNEILIEDRAIVTDMAGTTRDVVEGSKIIGGVRFIFRDTAGLRETDCEIESAGISKSQEWMAKSDIILHIQDTLENKGLALDVNIYKNKKYIHVLNKVDLLFSQQELEGQSSRAQQIKSDYKFNALTSAKTGYGIRELEVLLTRYINERNSVQNTLHINQRQHKKINDSIEILQNTLQLNQDKQLSTELLAEELRSTISCLEEITGTISSDDVLGEIFERFCIGK